jgi:hypothetical protein
MAIHEGLMTVAFADAYGIPASEAFPVTYDDTKTIAQLMTDVHTGAGYMSLLSQGHQYKASITLFDNLVAPGVGLGDIEKGGLFNFNNASDDYATGVVVPDIAPAVLNASGLIDLTNVDVTNWVTWMTTAHTVIQVVTKGVRALTTLRDALISFRKHRKPLARKTKEL